MSRSYVALEGVFPQGPIHVIAGGSLAWCRDRATKRLPLPPNTEIQIMAFVEAFAAHICLTCGQELCDVPDHAAGKAGKA